MEIEGETWGICGNLPYLYQQCENYTASIECGKKLLKYPEAKDENVRNEIYGIIADGNYWLGNIEEGISWLDKIISDCTDQELLTHTKNVREGWIAQM